MIPTWHTPPAGEERVTKNPFKLLGMVGPFAWMMFFSGWLAWTMDGYE
jgi:SHS family lactate transporter-like MFS transporter